MVNLFIFVAGFADNEKICYHIFAVVQHLHIPHRPAVVGRQPRVTYVLRAQCAAGAGHAGRAGGSEAVCRAGGRHPQGVLRGYDGDSVGEGQYSAVHAAGQSVGMDAGGGVLSVHSAGTGAFPAPGVHGKGVSGGQCLRLGGHPRVQGEADNAGYLGPGGYHHGLRGRGRVCALLRCSGIFLRCLGRQVIQAGGGLLQECKGGGLRRFPLLAGDPDRAE